MLKYRIFIAGAKDLREVRLNMKALVNDLNTKYSKEGLPVTVNMVSYENFGDQQKDYNFFIEKKANMVIFILDGRIGKKTEEEYRLANKVWKEQHRPKITTFLHSFSQRTEDIEHIEEVVNEVSDKYYVEYKNSDDLLLKASDRIDEDVRYHIQSGKNKRIYKNIKVWGIALLITLLVALSAYLYSILLPQRLLYINISDLPTSLSNSGITKQLVKDSFVEMQASLQSTAQNKANKLFAILGKDSADWHYELQDKNLNNLEIKEGIPRLEYNLRSLFGKKDIITDIKIIETDSSFVNKAIVYMQDGKQKSRIFEERKKSFDNKQHCAINAIKKSSVYVFEAFSPIISVLYDFQPMEGLNEYEQRNPWREDLYTDAERVGILEEAIRNNYADSMLCFICLGTFYEFNGTINSDELSLTKACDNYIRLSKSDKNTGDKINERINFLHSLLVPKSIISLPDQLINDGKIPKDACRQLIIVNQQEQKYIDGVNHYFAMLHAFEKKENKWNEIAKPYQVNLGINGIAPDGQKVEGDLKTPSGYFPLPFVFGYQKDIETEMEFLVINQRHVWVCDKSDKKYNEIVEDNDGTYLNNRINERLRRLDNLNKYAIVIGYNMSPVIKGKGSAIFIHVERHVNHRTAGCISMPEDSIVSLIKWLNPALSPHIYISK